MNLWKPPIGIPSLIAIADFQAATRQGASTITPGIFQEVKDRYEPIRFETDDALAFMAGSSEAYVKAFQEDDFLTVLVALQPKEEAAPRTSFSQVQAACEADMQTLIQLLPNDLVSLFTLHIGQAKNLSGAKSLVEGYADRSRSVLRGMGIIRGCVASTLGEHASDEGANPSRREMVVVPFSGSSDRASSAVWGFARDMVSLASYGGRLSQLRSNRELMLRQMDASEESTQLRIDEILMELRRPTEQLKPEDLEEVLREVTVLFSRLSVLASSMRRDYVKANAVLRRVTALFKAWNEQSLEGYATNSSVETDAYEGLVSPFRDFIDRVEALRAQLDTVLDAVRTYLGIQGQRLSIEEQRSSKEQLLRMVNLQEILHKLEILIVAFYLTEMARLFFEALAQESANLLTLAFIPAAFLTAILTMRFLHKQRGKEAKPT
ncbi:MAG: hypothetical protein QW057_06210 [Candidatus Bathyarchaeia archaeon]